MRIGCGSQFGGCSCGMHVHDDLVFAARQILPKCTSMRCVHIVIVCSGHTTQEGAHAHKVGQCGMTYAASFGPRPPRPFLFRAVGFKPVPMASRWLHPVAGSCTRYEICSCLRGLVVAFYWTIAWLWSASAVDAALCELVFAVRASRAHGSSNRVSN